MKSENPDFKSFTGCGLLIFLICIGIGGCSYLESKGHALVNQSKQHQTK